MEVRKTEMEKLKDKKNNTKKNNPVKLEDLIPQDNVSGGKTKTVFGIIRNTDRKGSNLQ